jgi:hypothetical protein
VVGFRSDWALCCCCRYAFAQIKHLPLSRGAESFLGAPVIIKKFRSVVSLLVFLLVASAYLSPSFWLLSTILPILSIISMILSTTSAYQSFAKALLSVALAVLSVALALLSFTSTVLSAALALLSFALTFLIPKYLSSQCF